MKYNFYLGGIMEKTSCWDCEHLNKSIYMKLEDEILYNCWCKVGDMEEGSCDKFKNIIMK